jgi:23S rRNA G2445 N2-methylase RlmL
MQTAYNACLRLRGAVRVLHLLSVQTMNPDSGGYDELYAAVRRAAVWPDHMRPGMTLSVDLRLRSCNGWNNSAAARNCILAAISDAVRDKGCVC